MLGDPDEVSFPVLAGENDPALIGESKPEKPALTGETLPKLLQLMFKLR